MVRLFSVVLDSSLRDDDSDTFCGFWFWRWRAHFRAGMYRKRIALACHLRAAGHACRKETAASCVLSLRVHFPFGCAPIMALTPYAVRMMSGRTPPYTYKHDNTSPFWAGMFARSGLLTPYLPPPHLSGERRLLAATCRRDCMNRTRITPALREQRLRGAWHLLRGGLVCDEKKRFCWAGATRYLPGFSAAAENRRTSYSTPILLCGMCNLSSSAS